MFDYAQGRFSRRLLSFAIPEKYYLNAESTDDDTMELLSPDRKTSLHFALELGCKGTAERLLFDEEEFSQEYIFKDPIEPLQINGLAGHFRLYGTELRQYCELRLCLEHREEGDAELYVMIATEGNIREYMESPVCRQFLSSIRNGE